MQPDSLAGSFSVHHVFHYTVLPLVLPHTSVPHFSCYWVATGDLHPVLSLYASPLPGCSDVCPELQLSLLQLTVPESPPNWLLKFPAQMFQPPCSLEPSLAPSCHICLRGGGCVTPSTTILSLHGLSLSSALHFPSSASLGFFLLASDLQPPLISWVARILQVVS